MQSILFLNETPAIMVRLTIEKHDTLQCAMANTILQGFVKGTRKRGSLKGIGLTMSMSGPVCL